MKNFCKTHENTIYIVLYTLCNLILMGIFVWCTTPLMLYPLAVLWFGGFAIHALLMARKHLTESPNEKVKKMLDDIVWKLQHEPTCVLRLSFENIKMRNAFYQLMVDPEDGFLQDMYEMAADRAGVHLKEKPRFTSNWLGIEDPEDNGENEGIIHNQGKNPNETEKT